MLGIIEVGIQNSVSKKIKSIVVEKLDTINNK
jgi:hypothetical protein